MTDIPQSRTEEILYATINGEEYTGLPESRIEELLLELKEVIEEGGGGGGGTSTIAWKPTVAADGTISWVRTTSETKPEDQNIKGPKGDTGETGAKGDTGETGSQGPKGDDGDPGLGIKLVSINQNGHLIITFDDDTTQDAGAIPGGGGAVDSVNGKTGTVTLDAEDVGALPDDTTIPSKTSDLTNDSGFITKAVNDLINYYLKSETYTKAEVNALIGAISTIHFEAVLTLPTENIQTNVIYLVPKSISQSDNIKDEYINLDGTTAGWEKIGETEIDLSNYVTTTALNTALADYVTSTSLATTLASYATAASVSAITDGQTIDSFSDVETALAGKANTEPYFEQSVTLSTSTTTTVTFTDARILATSVIDPAVSVWGIFPEDVTVASGSCTVVMPKVSTAQTVTVGIFIKR